MVVRQLLCALLQEKKKSICICLLSLRGNTPKRPLLIGYCLKNTEERCELKSLISVQIVLCQKCG